MQRISCSTIFGPSFTWASLLCVLAIAGALITVRSASAVPDTTYINNAYTGSTVDGTITYPFKTIAAALSARTGGPDTVFAVMGSNTPYREAITIGARDSGAVVSGVVHPFVLFARGNVTLDGGDAPPDNSDPAETDPNRWTPRYAAPNSTIKLWTAIDTTNTTVKQVIMYSSSLELERRYPHVGTFTSLAAIPVGQCYYDDTADTVYVNFDDPSHNYYADDGFLCTRTTLRLQVPNVVVDGFTILRSAADGVLIDHSSNAIRNVTIKHCTIRQSAEDGIDITRGNYCTLSNNASSENTKNGIFVKTSVSGKPVENCAVAGNTCSFNNNQSVADGSAGDDINGIRIGNQAAEANAAFGNHTISGNKAYSNEDSGIDVRGSHGNLFRYNQSWANGDHGFDHLAAYYNEHVGDLAYANGHDGLSAENTTRGTKMRNCIMMDNARDTGQQDYELEVIGAARDSFVGNYNVMFRPSGRSGGCGSWSEAQDTILVAWATLDHQAGCQVRCSNPDSCFGTLARFATAGVNPNHNEANSKQADPNWANAAVPDFRPFWSSPMADAADTTVGGYAPTDVTGLERYDCVAIPNTGNPAAAYADIGPLEYSFGMSGLGVTAQLYNVVSVNWTATGRYGDSNWKPMWYKIYVDGVLKKTKVAANMSWPGYIVESVSAARPIRISRALIR